MSRVKSEPSRLDRELLILVPIFTVLMGGVAGRLWHQWSTGEFSGGTGALMLVQGLLRLAFYMLMVSLLLVRKKSRSSRATRRATVAAYVGTFASFLLLLEDAPARQSPALVLLSIVVTTVGLALSVYALGWLGRSFGVVPQARELVRSGPYRYVRHPLYVAELVAFCGTVLAALTPFSMAVLILLVSAQAYRASQEEKVLRDAFPEYESYMTQAGRFTPRLSLAARAS